MPRCPPSVTATILLIALGGLTWLMLGVLLAMNAHPAFPDDPSIRGWLAALSGAAGCALLLLLVFLLRRQRLTYFLMLGTLALASLAVFLDDVGWLDLVVLAVYVIPLALLIKDRAWYAQV